SRLFRQCLERGWRCEPVRMVMRVLCFFQRTGAQPCGEFWIFCFPRQAEMGEGAWPPQRLMLYEKCVEPFKALDELRMGIHRENPRGWLNAARRQDDGRSSRLPMFTYRISVQEAK